MFMYLCIFNKFDELFLSSNFGGYSLKIAKDIAIFQNFPVFAHE